MNKNEKEQRSVQDSSPCTAINKQIITENVSKYHTKWNDCPELVLKDDQLIHRSQQ